MMRSFLLLSVMLCLCTFSFAQTDSLQKQINEQVWKPLILAFSTGNDRDFRAVHSEAINPDSNEIKKQSPFYKHFIKLHDRKAKTEAQAIELRFTDRILSLEAGIAMYGGYYKITNIKVGGVKSQIIFGKFLAMLKKENGLWKILVNAEPNDKTTEEIFQTGSPIE